MSVLLTSSLMILRFVRKHLGGLSLETVVGTSREWWTPKAKVKAIVRPAFGLCFAQSLEFQTPEGNSARTGIREDCQERIGKSMARFEHFQEFIPRL
jgi:hypothetical protein